MRIVLVLALVSSVLACGSSKQQLTSGMVMPDFSLVDQNPNSTRAGMAVGPHTFTGKVSGWYFLHTT